jgi:hypothetical protein
MTHKCPVNGCEAVVPDRLLLCVDDWRLVPAPLQLAVYTAYRHGEGLYSAELLAAQHAAIRAVNDRSA